jgi:hypothetical protein
MTTKQQQPRTQSAMVVWRLALLGAISFSRWPCGPMFKLITFYDTRFNFNNGEINEVY